ncbi:threonine-phosphate decarboxylase [uncultured Roseobacter sp.]|uniref:threonine-phosphate decarboxylase n=1 Tax=uncultured Roseobacter sp. TaxID=114847 RepID=UPI00261CE56F|nr:threonine-phosphate decarboxylase [uncultured Roseobacter sp.]
MTKEQRDHGGGIDAAIARFKGTRIGWIDLSTGINPHPYPIRTLPSDAWTALPDSAAASRLLDAARTLWNVPPEADLLAAPGASSLIARIPGLAPAGSVAIPGPTYNEHAAAFAAHGWTVTDRTDATAQVIVHPNNPDGRIWTQQTLPAPQAALTIIDESFCDVSPTQSLMARAAAPGSLVLKSFGKFWGLAGLRLGFVAGDPGLVAQLRAALGPWPVAGPALAVGAEALADAGWARTTRARLAEDAARLDALMQIAGARVLGGTTLFRLYEVEDAAAWQTKLAQHRIWSRIFPYNPRWLRLGLPHALHWPRINAALA